MKLFRLSAFLGNPWGRLRLAEVLETGEGTERNLAQALDLYRQAATQNREPDAKRRAEEALNRLRAVTGEKSREAADHSVSASPERRLALVIGNSNYAHIGPILNPRNDAEDMATLLKGLGFEVTLRIDLKRADMEDTLIRFARDIRTADTALVFYAGHGIQHQGVNYLAPIDARIEDETDLRKLINLQAMIDDLQSASRIRILLIDACRDNKGVQQLNAKLPRATREAGLTRGLARIDGAEGTLVVFATQPNRVAADGKGRNSPFAQALLKHLPTPGVEIRTLLTRVRADVVASTSDKQRPELYDSLVGEFVLNTGAGAQPSAAQAPGLPANQSAPGPGQEARPVTPAPASSSPSPAVAIPPLRETLLKRLAAYTVPANESESQVRNFEAEGAHKAIAVSPETHHTFRTSRWASSAAAEIGALEGCQLQHGKPCSLLAVDDKVDPPNQGSPTLQDMPRTRYAGLFEPEQIPRIRPETVRRADVVGYRSAPEPKAAAFHVQGNLFIVTGAASQLEAEEQGLARCNDDPVRKGADGPCWLYAVGNQVVPPQRSTKPLTPRRIDSTPSQHAAIPPAPASSPLSFHDQLVARLAGLSVAAGEAEARNYEANKDHKAIAAGVKARFTWRTSQWGTDDEAVTVVLERCQIYYGELCTLVAVGDKVELASDGAPLLRDMPRARYNGLFEPDQIPGVDSGLRQRADVVSYRSATGSRAIAYHPTGRLFIARGIGQFEAEELALKQCNDDPDRKGQAGPCFLYAAGNQVVLPQRSVKTLSHRQTEQQQPQK